MKTGTEVPNKWRWRLTRIAVVIVLMGASFAVGVTLVDTLSAWFRDLCLTLAPGLRT